MHDGVRAATDERDFAVRLARYCTRNPVALGRMEYHASSPAVARSTQTLEVHRHHYLGTR